MMCFQWGKAFPNERVFLLDENDKLIKNSEADKTGEICVSGTAVTMGYFNNKEKTDSAFVQNPLNGSYNEIIYRLVIWDIIMIIRKCVSRQERTSR